MPSLIDSVRKLHGPTLVPLEEGHDADVVCEHCTALVTDALTRAGAETRGAQVPWPCESAMVAGTSAEAGEAQSRALRIDFLVARRDEHVEALDRITAVLGLLEGQDAAPVPEDAEDEPVKEPAKPRRTDRAKNTKSAEPPAEPDPAEDAPAGEEPTVETDDDDPYDF